MPDTSEAVRFVRLFEEWNSYVKKTYNSWISVRGTISGPVWLEGYNEQHASFGFLDMLTRNLIIGGQYVSNRIIHMPTKWDALKEIRRVAESCTEDVKLIEKELYGNVLERNCESEVTVKEVARCMISGAFSSGFTIHKVSTFFLKSTEQGGYWSTDIYCRNGELQILFRNRLGVVRIVRRATEVGYFLAAGIVHPEDSDVVLEISEEITEDMESTRANKFWKSGPVREVTKSDMMARFSLAKILAMGELCALSI